MTSLRSSIWFAILYQAVAAALVIFLLLARPSSPVSFGAGILSALAYAASVWSLVRGLGLIDEAEQERARAWRAQVSEREPSRLRGFPSRGRA